MNYYFIILVMLFSFSTSYAREEGDINLQYTQALKEYKAKNFNASYKIFSKLYLSKLSDAKLNFYFGRSAYETGHYEMALAAFERVEMLDASNLRNKLEMARTYFMLKMYEDAENAFKEVLANPNIPQNIRTKIEFSLSRVTKVQQHSFTHSKVMLNVMYDSNVNYGSIGDYQYGSSIIPPVKEVSDYAFEAYSNIVNIYDIGTKGDFAIKNSVSFYIKNYRKLNAYDLQYIAYTPSLLYTNIHYLIDLNIGIDFMTLGRESYLKTVFFAPKFEYRHTTTLKSIVGIKYQKKDFIQKARNNLDANRYELLYGLQKILSPRSYIRADVNMIFERKLRDGNIYVDFDEYKASVAYVSQLNTIWSVDGFVQLRNRKYIDYSYGFGSTREDTGGLVNIGMGAEILPTLKANLKGSYEYVDSNQDRFTYKKYTISFGIVKTF